MMARGGGPAFWALFVVIGCALLVPAESSYRFGTLSWKLVKEPGVPEYTVDFELTTAWRRDFHWVYVQQRKIEGQTRNLESAPIVGDKLRVTGLSFADSSGQQAVAEGTSEILFHTGDGEKYFVDVDVTAYSAEGKWVMGTTRIRHTYKTPFKEKGQNIYPTGFEYKAATGAQLDANQPYAHVPWTAYFEGCCRWSGSENNANQPYKVVTNIDMTDRDNSPAARTMPIIVVPQAKSGQDIDQPRFYVMAKDQYVPGSQAPAGVSGGTSNYDEDNQMEANLTYAIADGTSDLRLPGTVSYAKLAHIQVEDPQMGRLKMTTNSTTGPLKEGFYQAAVRVDTCTSRNAIGVAKGFARQCLAGTIIDFMVHVVPNGENNDGHMPQPVTDTGVAYPHSGCDADHSHCQFAYEEKFGWVGFGLSASMAVDNTARGKPLVLNYVFAGLAVEGSSADPSADKGVHYSPSELSHQGMPAGAKLFSTATDAVVEIAISFDNPFSSHRPGHDAAMNKEKLDYAFAPRAKELWDAGFRPVLKANHGIDLIKYAALDTTISLAAFDLNVGTGGAAVYLWLRKSSTEKAVTELAISHCPSEENVLASRGFEKLAENVNEQSKSASDVYVWFKRGTGPAITDVILVDQAVDGTTVCGSKTTADSAELMEICDSQVSQQNNPKKTCGNATLVAGNLNYGGQQNLDGRGIFMYATHAPGSKLRRLLEWVPRVAGHYIFCYAGSEVGMPKISSTQRCIDFDIKRDPAPAFQPFAHRLNTSIGKTLVFNVSYVDIHHAEEIVSVEPATDGLQLTGQKFLGPPTRTAVGRSIRTTQVVEWFPDWSYGGFHGDVCFLGKDSAGGEGGAHRQTHTTRGCVNIFVERCKWYVQTEDTLIQIAARFATNWLQIWHFNPTILHPDSELPPGDVINIGHLYEVEPNDALSVLADRFGTSIKHIKMNNWDLGSLTDAQLPLGKSICVIPNSCVTAEHVVRDVAA